VKDDVVFSQTMIEPKDCTHILANQARSNLALRVEGFEAARHRLAGVVVGLKVRTEARERYHQNITSTLGKAMATTPLQERARNTPELSRSAFHN
jgi:hypothetical protein